MTEVVHPTFEAIREAIDRIARTPDGAALYVFLQRRMMAVPNSPKSGALRQDHGERMFAAKLIGLMAKGIAESGGRTSSSSGGASSDSEQPIVVPSVGPRRVGPARTPGPRVNADTIVPGWNDDPA